MIGIYSIQSPSGKVYIGQSWDIKRRHQWYKSHEASEQPYLSNSFKKYGFDSHETKVLLELPCDVEQSVLDFYEQYYIDVYRQAGFVLLNLKEGGKGGKHCETTKRQMSVSHTGKKLSLGAIEKLKNRSYSKEHRTKIGLSNKRRSYSEQTIEKMKKTSRCKPVIQISISGEFIKEWASANEAARSLGFHCSHISKCAGGGKHRNTAGGFKWKYK